MICETEIAFRPHSKRVSRALVNGQENKASEFFNLLRKQTKTSNK